MLLERVENRQVVAFELELGDPSYIHDVRREGEGGGYPKANVVSEVA